jgi:hypothetical protein
LFKKFDRFTVESTDQESIQFCPAQSPAIITAAVRLTWALTPAQEGK